MGVGDTLPGPSLSAAPDAPMIIEVAVNGISSQRRNPNVPITNAEIAEDAIASIEAGAAIIHCHCEDSRASIEDTVAAYTEIFAPVLSSYPDALLYPTWRASDEAREQRSHMPGLASRRLVRFCYVDPGSTNHGITGPDGLPQGARVSATSYDECKVAFDIVRELRLGSAIGIFEPGYLRVVQAYEAAGKLPAGAFVRFYFGGDHSLVNGEPSAVSFGMPPSEACLLAYLDMHKASRIPWAVAVLGGDAVASPAGRLAVARGGHIRVGLEDYGGPRKPTNTELVRDAVELGARFGRRPATGSQAAQILNVPQPAEAV